MTEQQIRQLIKEELKTLLSDMFQSKPSVITRVEPVTKSINNITDISTTLTLNQIGIPVNVKGYKFLREAITEVYRDESKLDSMANLYELIAERYKSTPSKVERAMRHAIEVASDIGGMSHLFKEKPTNGRFIGLMAELFRQEGAERSYEKHDGR